MGFLRGFGNASTMIKPSPGLSVSQNDLATTLTPVSSCVPENLDEYCFTKITRIPSQNEYENSFFANHFNKSSGTLRIKRKHQRETVFNLFQDQEEQQKLLIKDQQGKLENKFHKIEMKESVPLKRRKSFFHLFSSKNRKPSNVQTEFTEEENQPLVVKNDESKRGTIREFFTRARLKEKLSLFGKYPQNISPENSVFEVQETLTQRYMGNNYATLLDDMDAVPFDLSIKNTNSDIFSIHSKISQKLANTFTPKKKSSIYNEQDNEIVSVKISTDQLVSLKLLENPYDVAKKLQDLDMGTITSKELEMAQRTIVNNLKSFENLRKSLSIRFFSKKKHEPYDNISCNFETIESQKTKTIEFPSEQVEIEDKTNFFINDNNNQFEDTVVEQLTSFEIYQHPYENKSNQIFSLYSKPKSFIINEEKNWINLKMDILKNQKISREMLKIPNILKSGGIERH